MCNTQRTIPSQLPWQGLDSELFLSQKLSEHMRRSLLLQFSYFCCLHLQNKKSTNHANKGLNMLFKNSLISLVGTLL